MSSNTRVADSFKTPVANYQLDTTTNDASVTIPWANRCISIYSRDKQHRWNVNAASASNTHFMAQDERLLIRMPDNDGQDIKLHARVNGTGTGSLEITAYAEDS
tara:strand:+ start:79 stop:390 length:312 start_codon:yes stop_codon:yes gene_type:complete